MAIPGPGATGGPAARRAPAGLPKDRWRRVSWIARNGGAPPGEESRSTRLPGLRPRSDRAMRDRGWTRPKPAGRLRSKIGPSPPMPALRDRGLSAPSPSAPGPTDPIPREDRRRAPDYRVSAEGAGLGVALKATRQDKNASFGEAADISFGEPVNAAPVVIDGAYPWPARASPPRPSEVQGTPRQGCPARREIWSAPLGPTGPHKKTRPIPRDRPRRVMPCRGGQDARPDTP